MHLRPLTDDIPADPDAGIGALHTERGNLPLEAVTVRARVTGLAARVEMVQEFHNPFDVTLEATYVFPLPDRAAVTALRMEAAGHVIEGVLKERGQARDDYDAALAAGRRAAIAEEERSDVFSMRAGNLLPGEHMTVTLVLNQPLPYEDGEATLRFPLVVAPRYVPGRPLDGPSAGDGVQPDTDAAPDASRISPPVLLPGFPSPVRLSLSVHIDPAGLPLGEVRSSLHVTDDDEGTLRLRPGERLDRDFVLRLRYDTGASCTATDETFTLTVVPPAPAATQRPRDVVIVLDRSGSMGGWKIVAARRAAARIVDTLDGTDRFAVLSFDHTVDHALPGGLAPATDRHRFRAVEHLTGLEARGGTEMLTPLREAVGLLADASRDRVLVLVTDGQIGNEDQILHGLAPGLAGIRVHTVGIDQAVNAGFLGRLAGLGGGRSELVESEDRLDEVMDHIHRRIAAPLVTGITLDLSGADPATFTPARPSDLFPGVPLVIRGRRMTLTTLPVEPPTGASKAVVRGVASDGSEWTQRVAITSADDPAATPIWARAHLRELEDRLASGSYEAGLEQQIIDTSLRFGVLCKFTAFVAVDTRVATDGSPEHRVIQPVEAPAGWEDAETSAYLASAPPAPGAVGGFAATRSIAPSAPRPGPSPRPAPAGGYGGGPPPPSGPARGSVARRSRAVHSHQEDAALPIDPRTQVSDELARLREADPENDTERRQILADLATRLAIIVPNELTGLIAALRTCDNPTGPRGQALQDLWNRTLHDLATYTQQKPSHPTRFWNRRPT